VLLSLGVGLTTAHALDRKTPANAVPEIPGVGPVAPPQEPAADPSGLAAFFLKMQAGDTEGAVKELESAFRNKGNIRAGWKLGRMYADGDGVPQDRIRAFEIFRVIVESQRGEVPSGPSARFIANAMVTMGLYHSTGIPNSHIKVDLVRAFDAFHDAAINYADADGQYHLALAYRDGQGVVKNPALASKWFYQAAIKGQYEAQAEFGRLLVQGFGQAIPRDVAKGLVWLKIALETAPQGAPGIQELYSSAWKQATDRERSDAEVLFEQWKKRGGRWHEAP
jgi:TPR repeat protein